MLLITLVSYQQITNICNGDISRQKDDSLRILILSSSTDFIVFTMTF